MLGNYPERWYMVGGVVALAALFYLIPTVRGRRLPSHSDEEFLRAFEGLSTQEELLAARKLLARRSALPENRLRPNLTVGEILRVKGSMAGMEFSDFLEDLVKDIGESPDTFEPSGMTVKDLVMIVVEKGDRAMEYGD